MLKINLLLAAKIRILLVSLTLRRRPSKLLAGIEESFCNLLRNLLKRLCKKSVIEIADFSSKWLAKSQKNTTLEENWSVSLSHAAVFSFTAFQLSTSTTSELLKRTTSFSSMCKQSRPAITRLNLTWHTHVTTFSRKPTTIQIVQWVSLLNSNSMFRWNSKIESLRWMT